MKKFLMFFAAIMIVAGITNRGFAQSSGITVPNDANAEIKTALTLEAKVDLEFGKMAVTGTAGTVVLTDAGVPTATNVQLLNGTTRTGGSYDATGQASATYTITLPTSDVTITTSTGSGTKTMIVNSFTTTTTPQFDGTGKQTFKVGATLHVGETQAIGVYTGPFNVKIDY